MNKWTPGPWKVRDIDGSLGTIETLDGAIQIGQACQVSPTDRITKHAERIANARLIAAAPELVEALEGICMAYELLCDMHAHSFYKEPSSRAYAARALLARIKGEQ